MSFTPIPEGSLATPGLFNSRFSELARNISGVRTLVSGDTFPSVATASALVTSNLTATTISNFSNGTSGQLITLQANDGLTTLSNTTTLQTGLGVNLSLVTGRTLAMQQYGGVWYVLNPLQLDADSVLSVPGVRAQVRASGTAPTSGVSSGVAGDVRWDANYVYVCTSSNSWSRATLNRF